MVPPDASDQLRLAGLRVTAPRQAVLQWLAEHSHATAVFWGLCPTCPTCPTCRAVAAVPDDDDEKNPTHYEEAR